MAQTEQFKLEDLINEWGITFEVIQVDRNPDMVDDEWAKTASHWKCTLKRGHSLKLECHYSMGSAHRHWKRLPYGVLSDHDRKMLGYKPGEKVTYNPRPLTLWAEEVLKKYTEPTPPECKDILDTLALEACDYDNSQNFSEWCSNFGYSNDYIKAKKAYNNVGEQTKALKHFLGGSENFDKLLYKTERL